MDVRFEVALCNLLASGSIGRSCCVHPFIHEALQSSSEHGRDEEGVTIRSI